MKRFSTRVLAIAAGIAFACGVAAAQDAPAAAAKPADAAPGAPGAGMRMRQGGGAGAAMMKIRLAKDLKLSDEAKAKVEAAEKALQDELKPLREESQKLREETDPAKREEAMKGLRDKRDAIQKKAADAIDAALTPEQKTELEAKVKEAGERFREGRGRGEGYGQKPAEKPAEKAAATTATITPKQ
jgi:Spy/CpxP family protein refolding chaperone